MTFDRWYIYYEISIFEYFNEHIYVQINKSIELVLWTNTEMKMVYVIIVVDNMINMTDLSLITVQIFTFIYMFLDMLSLSYCLR